MCHMSHILIVNQDSVLGYIRSSATQNFKDIRAKTISKKMIKVPRRQLEGDLLTFLKWSDQALEIPFFL